MKKFIAAAAVAASIASSSAFAKTEGHYVGIDFIKTSATNRYQDGGNNSSSINKFKDTSNGVGISYKHAFNFDGAFVAPGIFFDRLGSNATDPNGGSVVINSRHGVKIDFGYDFNDNFSAYVTNGIANVRYKVNMSEIGTNNDSKLAYFYGVGLSSKITNELSLNVEYNIQNVNLTAASGAQGLDHIRSKLSVAKLGVTYHF